MVTQWPFNKCSDRMQWLIHLLIFTGYTSVFMMVVVGLRWFQRDSVIDPNWPTVSVVMTIIGYYATAAILVATSYAFYGRIKKTKRPYMNSHGTDWMFLILLWLTTFTGILVHIFIYLGWAHALLPDLRVPSDGGHPHAGIGSAVCQVGSLGIPADRAIPAGRPGRLQKKDQMAPAPVVAEPVAEAPAEAAEEAEAVA